jgi:hypothetical protein
MRLREQKLLRVQIVIVNQLRQHTQLLRQPRQLVQVVVLAHGVSTVRVFLVILP